MRYSRAVVRFLAALAALSACGCSGAEPSCRSEPLGVVTVYLGESSTSRSVRVSGTIEESGRAEDDLGLRHYQIEDSSGVRHRLTYGSPVGPPPFTRGEVYDVQVDYVPGMPSPAGIVVSDDDGLVFAAASDYGPGERVLVDGVPGFRLSLVSADCPNRSRDRCYDSIVNARLRVETGDQTVELFQGESADLRGYHVTCLMAQDVAYSDECADAGVFRTSYTIVRLSE